MKNCCFTIVLLSVHFVQAQWSCLQKSDTLNSKRVGVVTGGIGASWAMGTIGFSALWYNDYPKSKLHSFDDSHNWLQMDKAGHLYTAHRLSLISGSLFRWSGVQQNKSAWLGMGVGLGLQTTLELMDGTSDGWGFSWSDMAANTLGTCLYGFQDLAWKEQRILLKFSYHETSYAEVRPEVLGSSFSERFLKDYNGQTYWLSISPGMFAKSSRFPNWLCFSLGYSVDAKLQGDQEFYFDASHQQAYYSKREWLLSLDLDVSQLTIKRRWLKAILSPFNYIKVPFPSLLLSDGKLVAKGLYF